MAPIPSQLKLAKDKEQRSVFSLSPTGASPIDEYLPLQQLQEYYQNNGNGSRTEDNWETQSNNKQQRVSIGSHFQTAIPKRLIQEAQQMKTGGKQLHQQDYNP